MNDTDEERRIRSVLHQNAESILIARQRAERELELAKESLEVRTAELATALALTQATLESTADGILATDQAGHVTRFNERFLAMWRIPREVIATGEHRALLEAMSRQMPDRGHLPRDVVAIHAAAPAETFDLLALADGRVFERYTRIQKIEDRAIGRVWSYRDVTERSQAEAALREATIRAEAANRTKTAFLATMSHELRTPLNAIAGYTQIVQMGIHGPVTEQQAEALRRIQASQRHLLGLIDEVLLHAKLETGLVHYDLARVDAREAIAGAVALVEPQAWAKGVSLAPPPEQPRVFLRADTEKLQQILINLLSNAVKFTVGGGRIDIGCTASDGKACIEIRDTGIGIPREMLDRIFEPFVQVRSELTRIANGTGLGLTISRTLARDMQGDITVRSEAGAGSSFRLVLPAG